MNYEFPIINNISDVLPAEVLKKMQDSYEIPLHSEGFENIIFI